MINTHIDLILVVLGVITTSMILQAIAPKYVLSMFFKKEITDPYALFLARSSGIPIAIIGMLMIWASFDETLRIPVVVAAVVGKALFLLTIASNWKVTGPPYFLTIAIDSISVVLLLLYLLGF
jgi:hypothetical protein